MTRKSTVVPESALMEAFEQGKMLAWSSAYDAGFENGYVTAQQEVDDWHWDDKYQQGRADAAESIARWLDILPDEVFAVLRPHLVHALTVALSDEPPF